MILFMQNSTCVVNEFLEKLCFKISCGTIYGIVKKIKTTPMTMDRWL